MRTPASPGRIVPACSCRVSPVATDRVAERAGAEVSADLRGVRS